MIRFISFVGLVLALAPAARAEDKVGESPLYPAKIGSTWTYRLGEKKLTTKITKHESKGGHMCALLETMADGNTVATEHVAVTKDGLLRTSFGGQVPDKPVMFLKFAAKNGESWDVESKVAGQEVKGKFTRGEEDVDVPAYKGKAISSKGDFNIMGQTVTFAFWFAEGKGIVKSQAGVAGQVITMELESFQEGK